MKQKLHLHAKVFSAEDDRDLLELARSKGIEVPSIHLAFFKSVYARLEVANRNGVRLATEAVEKSIKGLVGAQVNLEHLGEGFIVGNVLDAWINAEDQIEIAFTFFKQVYKEKFKEATTKLEDGDLSVSFELLSDRSSQEFLADGTVKLNDIDFTGVGLLLENPPAEPSAKVFEMAKKYKQRVKECNRKQLICASQILETCDKVLGEKPEVPETHFIMNIRARTSMNNGHWHFAVIDADGNGETEGTFGNDILQHNHPIVNFQIQEVNDHEHSIMQEVLDQIQRAFKETKEEKTDQGGKQFMDEKVKEEKEVKADMSEEVTENRKIEVTEEDDGTQVTKETLNRETKLRFASVEEAISKVEELEAKVEELTEIIEASKSEKEEIRLNAEAIGKLKVELKDNPHVADFADEDYLDEDKVDNAKIKHSNDILKAENEKLKQAKSEVEKEVETDKVEAKEETEESKLETHKATEDTVDTASVLRRWYNRNKKEKK